MVISDVSANVTYPKLWSARALGLTKHSLISLKDVQFGIYKPKRGDVLVYDYGSNKGHVDLIINYDSVKKEFELIGGNRANAVRTLKMTLQKAILKNAKYVIMITPIKPIEKEITKFRYDTIKQHVTWYGGYFHGRKTANGERYDTSKFTAAHKTLPFNTIVKVINPKNNKSVKVRINDRCPKKNVLDVTPKAIRELGISSQKCYMVIRYEK